MRHHVAVLALAPFACAATATAQCTEGCTAIHTLTGEAAGDQYGWVSNDLGDIDGDGVHDFVLTAPTNDAAGVNAGRIYVYSGATGTELFRVTGGAANYWLGHDAGSAGDVDGDGVNDVIAGAPFNGTGRVVVHSGADGSHLQTITGQFSTDQFGYRVAGGGDFNGDGSPDVIIGAPLHDFAGVNAGRAYVYGGNPLQLICTMDGGAAGDFFGSGVAFVGDVNGDGRDDVAVGAQHAGAGSGGEAYVYSFSGLGCLQLHTLTPPGASNNFGLWFMNGGYDVDADGSPDIYVNDYAINKAHVFSGATGAHMMELNGDGAGQFGIGRMIDDIDDDGHADLLLAAWIQNTGAPNAGKAFVYSGADGSVFETFTHDVAGAGFGFDANGMGDVNGDGKFDHLITAASDLSNRGRAYVIAGSVGGVPGDVNGDGVVDVADLLAMLAEWGPCAACDSDFNGDGVVDVTDLLFLLANFS